MSELSVRLGMRDGDVGAAARIYEHTFGAKLGGLIKDPARRVRLCAHVFDPQRVFTVYASRLIGIASFREPGQPFGGPTFDLALSREFGLFGRPLAYLLLSLLKDERGHDTLAIDMIAVDPEARGQGAGKLLLTALLDHARALGLRRAQLEVATSNPRARALYAQVGFRSSGITKIPLVGRLIGVDAYETMVFVV
jgi:ribosomal protein S18 acetylase RimI-like enzyme